MARRSATKSNVADFRCFLDSINDAPEVIISVNDIPVDESFNVSDIEVGQRIQFVVLHITALVAFVYTLGYMLGVYVHRLNDSLTTINVSNVFTHIKDAVLIKQQEVMEWLTQSLTSTPTNSSTLTNSNQPIN